MDRWPDTLALRPGELDERIQRARYLIENEELSYEAISSLLKSIMKGYLLVPALTKMHGVWRGRKHRRGTHFDNVRDLWYPPAHLINRPGRLNYAGFPMLYCSPERKFAAHELRPNIEEWVTMLALQPDMPEREFALVPLGVDRSSPEALKILRWVPVRQNPYLRERLGSEENIAAWCAVDDFLAGLLTMKVSAGEEYKYRASNIVAEVALSARDEIGGMDGILYPSVATELNAFNFCFTPSAADNYLKPVTCHVFQLSSAPDPRHFVAHLVASSSEIAEDGTITWIFPPQSDNQRQDFFSRVCGPAWARGAELKFG